MKYQMSNAPVKQLAKKSLGVTILRPKNSRSGKTAGGGVVNYFIHGATGKITAGDFTTAKLIKLLQVGLPVQELNALQATLEVPMEKLVPMLGISKATLHRRKIEGKLGPAESDRVLRFAKLMGKALEVMEFEESARQWLTSPQFGLGGAVPLEYAETEVGAREVENLLGRIEYGVYS
jgi:putative toxin-antitoxin system antitoxin component (TIGR02293 family)